jgi:hypothetical protein
MTDSKVKSAKKLLAGGVLVQIFSIGRISWRRTDLYSEHSMPDSGCSSVFST